MVRKIAAALALVTLAGVASASESNDCREILWFTFCHSGRSDTTVKAPEMDPASAMAGLTLLAGGLAVLRGRRGRKSQE
jgi:hypothetical protein